VPDPLRDPDPPPLPSPRPEPEPSPGAAGAFGAFGGAVPVATSGEPARGRRAVGNGAPGPNSAAASAPAGSFGVLAETPGVELDAARPDDALGSPGLLDGKGAVEMT
jgi:hypothetical protein